MTLYDDLFFVKSHNTLVVYTIFWKLDYCYMLFFCVVVVVADTLPNEL